MNRRLFLSTTSGAGLAAAAGSTQKPAILGGKPVRSAKFTQWPIFGAEDEQALLSVLRSGKWNRSGQMVSRFEEKYAGALGAKHCLATANGTSALLTSLAALGIGPGDEVIVPPYTFIATVNVVLATGALPVFVDSDPQTFQIDAGKIEARITERTRLIMPVHVGGASADLDTILAIGRKRGIPVVEDACQSHLGEWRGKKVGTYGTTGCFSFQASKNLNCGEGGAILTSDDDLVERCFAFHNNSRGRKTDGYDFSYRSRGLNLRLTEFQAALLLSQMGPLEVQARTRESNAKYLSSLLRQIPGMEPVKDYAGCTRNAYHLYMMRYDASKFRGLPRAQFLKALAAEGIPASGGYSPLNKEPFLKSVLSSKAYRTAFPGKTLSQWDELNHCPENDRLCTEGVWLTQNMLLGGRADMEQIAEAIHKIHAHAADLLKS